jgi:hypothetical protein
MTMQLAINLSGGALIAAEIKGMRTVHASESVLTDALQSDVIAKFPPHYPDLSVTAWNVGDLRDWLSQAEAA